MSEIHYIGAAAAPLDVETSGDVVRAKYRFISADTDLSTYDGWYRAPEAVLRAALPLWQPRVDSQGRLAHLPAVADHTRSVRGIVGRVASAEWAEARLDEAGNRVPAGIDGWIEVPRAVNPGVAAAIEEGLIRATSFAGVGPVQSSHPEIAPIESEEMWRLNGSFGPDGRRIVYEMTEITEVMHQGLVDDGADPFARRIDASKNHASGGAPHHQEEERMDKRITAELELPEDASAEQIVSAIQAAKQTERVEAMGAELAAVKASLAEKDTEIEAAKAEVAKLVEARAVEQKQYAIKAMLDQAGAEGRYTPAERPALEKLAAADIEATKAALDLRPKSSAVPLGEQAPASLKDTESVDSALTEFEIQMMARLDLTKEQVLASRG